MCQMYFTPEIKEKIMQEGSEEQELTARTITQGCRKPDQNGLTIYSCSLQGTQLFGDVLSTLQLCSLEGLDGVQAV